MLRYLERTGLVVPRRTRSGYRLYGLLELNQLRSLKQLRRRFGVELREMAFAARLRYEPELRTAVDSWLARSEPTALGAALDWEQRKHERLLAA
jgi:MerR family transcriptional regulator, copper efflux regulator